MCNLAKEKLNQISDMYCKYLMLISNVTFNDEKTKEYVSKVSKKFKENIELLKKLNS